VIDPVILAALGTGTDTVAVIIGNTSIDPSPSETGKNGVPNNVLTDSRERVVVGVATRAGDATTPTTTGSFPFASAATFTAAFTITI
jgi:hypothetical protein